MPAKRHGKYLSKEYIAWQNMLARCRRKNHPSYHRYGGRGIAVCERWQTFEPFFNDMGPRPEGTSIDRINNDGNYEPSNCRWASWKTQMANKEQTVWVTGFGETLPKQVFCKKHGINTHTFDLRIKRGMSPEQAINNKKTKIPYNFKFTREQTDEIAALYQTKKYRLCDLAEKCGVATMTIQRIVKGTYWRNVA